MINLMTNFTPEQITDVFAKRWSIRDTVNFFIREECKLMNQSILNRYKDPPKVVHTVGHMIKVKVPGGQ